MGELPNHDLLILGEGKERTNLEKRAKELKIKLIMPGYIENPYPYFRDAEVFVLTSKYEGLPNVILEAWACGTPVVAVDSPGGVKDLIKNKETGLLVPQNDRKALSQAIKNLITQHQLREKIIKNAKSELSRYDVKTMVKRYEKLLM
jgi:glycosyltransferase involved in cell wall biosynthesis